MQIQINPTFTDRQPVLRTPGATLLMTPPIGEDYWWLRVPVSEHQAIVAFPKFMTVGVGFQIEDDWNTNLPYICSAERIYHHISHNKGDEAIAESDCIAAIQLIQATIADVWPSHDPAAIERMRQQEAGGL